jgi:hypothetical protein
MGQQQLQWQSPLIDQSIATGQRQQQLQWHWGRGNEATETVMAMAVTMAIDCISIVLQWRRQQSISDDGSIALGHCGRNNRNNCNGTGAMGQLQQQLQWQWGEAAMGMFCFKDQCHVLWLLKTCKTCGWPLFMKLFLRLKQASFDRKFHSD